MVKGTVERCGANHAEDSPPPGIILLKTRVNDNRLKRLTEAGVPVKNRDDARLDAAHEADANRVHRNPNALREKPDSGSPVFGLGGAGMVDGGELLPELLRNGFRIESFHLYRGQKGGEPDKMSTLVVTLGTTPGEAPSEVAVQAIQDEFAVTWEHLQLWANPPRKEDGVVVHTLNAAHRLPDKKAERKVLYDGGQWSLEAVEQED